MARLPFKSLFCEKYGCPPEEYGERAFRKCLYWHAWLLAPFVRLIARDFFREDFKFIHYLGDTVGVREATADVMEYSLLNRGRGRFLHTGLRIRVSGRKAHRLVFQLYQEAGEADADTAAAAPK